MPTQSQKTHLSKVLIDGNSLTLKKVHAIGDGAEVVVPPSVKKRIEASREFVKKIASQPTPTYGVNTGFGYLASRRIPKSQLNKLQHNLLRSHASGYGTPLSIPETRIAMALRLNVLVKGHAGVRYALCKALLDLIKAEIYPIIPEHGSVGASGDLAPLAHLALPLIGEGLVQYRGKTLPAAEALQAANLQPIRLAEKEGLALVNGTQIMLAVGGPALCKAALLLDKADKITALSYEALEARPDSLNALIHKTRGQLGQIQSAHSILKELEGSSLLAPKRSYARVQDPYSLRCAPQIHGPSRDAIGYAVQIIEKELNAATDNPLVFVDHKKILSGGNFHGQALAIAFDIAAMALSELANVSERRLELLLNPNFSQLPAFLSPKGGTHSGYMAAQYLSASLVNENKLLANPACTDSIPGNVGVEDHVSMGMTSARKLKRLVNNVQAVLSIEMMAAAQAIDMHKRKRLGHGTSRSYQLIRSAIPRLAEDRIVSYDVDQALKVFQHL